MLSSPLPFQKCQHLVAAFRSIGSGRDPSLPPLSADDLLPMVISSLSRLNLPRLFSLSRLLTLTSPPHGEVSYWVATLEAAAEYLWDEARREEDEARKGKAGEDMMKLEGMLAKSGFIG